MKGLNKCRGTTSVYKAASPLPPRMAAFCQWAGPATNQSRSKTGMGKELGHIQCSLVRILLAFLMKLLFLQETWHSRPKTVMPGSLPGPREHRTPVVENHTFSSLLQWPPPFLLKMSCLKKTESPLTKHGFLLTKTQMLHKSCGLY